MRPLLVVLDEPILRDLLHLLDRFEDVGAEYFGSVRLVEALDERVLIRLAGLDETQLDLPLSRPLDKGVACQLAAVVQAQRFRSSVELDQLITRMARWLGIDVATSMPSAWRLPSSSTFNVRKRRPS